MKGANQFTWRPAGQTLRPLVSRRFHGFVERLDWEAIKRIAHAEALRRYGKLAKDGNRYAPGRLVRSASRPDNISEEWIAFWRKRSDLLLALCRWNGWRVEDQHAKGWA